MLRALIFDVDGTLADTEEAHRAAFNYAFDALDLGWHWDEALYTELLQISGGKERTLHYWRQVNPDIKALDGHAIEETVARIHELKTAHYEATVNSGGVVLRPGVLELIEEAQGQGLRLAIATTTSPVNIAALLRAALGPYWQHNFAAIGDASSAPIKKPHPQVYLQMLDALKLDARACLAFEDSSNGLRAASAAGLATLITPTNYTRHHDFGQAMRVLPDLAGVGLSQLQEWHQSFQSGERVAAIQ